MSKTVKIAYIFIFLFVSSIAYSQENSKDVAKINLDSIDDNSGLAIMDSSIAGYKIFFTGENHLFQKSNVGLELKMLKYLYKNAGVRYLFLEFAYSRAWLIDKYVQTGDTNIFKVLEAYSFKTFSKFYKDLYTFNSSLDSNNKIHIIGIDCERFLGTPTKVLSLLLPSKTPPTEIELSIESLKGLASFNDDYYSKRSENNEKFDFYRKNDYSNKNTMKLILEDYMKNKSIFEKYIGPENFNTFNETMISIESFMKWDSYNEENVTQKYVYREQYMYHEFMKAFKTYNKGNFFAQFGRCHVSTVNQKEACNWFDFNSIATRLNNSEDTIIKNKVFSIGVFYPKEEEIENNDSVSFNRIFERANKDGYSLMKITKDSIFDLVRTKYNFLIINQNTSENEIEENTDVEDSDYIKPVSLFHINLLFGQQVFDFKNFNNHLITINLPKLNQNIQHVGFGFTTVVKRKMSIDYTCNVFMEQDANFSNDSSFLFNGYNSFASFGYDLINKQFAHFIPSIGIGSGQLKYVITQPSKNSLFGERTVTTYLNPAFLMSLSLDTRINIKFFSLGFKASYINDFSNAKWRNNNKIIAGSPKTGMSGIQLSGTISVLMK